MQDKQTTSFAVMFGLGMVLGVPRYAFAEEPSRPMERLSDDDGLKVFEAAGCEPANVVCLDGDGDGLARGSKNDRDRLPANLDQGERLTVKVVGCKDRYRDVDFTLSLVGGAKHEQLFRADFAASTDTKKLQDDQGDVPTPCTNPTDFTVLSSVVLEVPAASSVELTFERKAGEAIPLPAAHHVHGARVLRPLYFLDVSVAAPFVIGGKRKVSTRTVPAIDGSVLTLEEDLHISPAVMLHVFPGGRRLGAISSFGEDRYCPRIQGTDKPERDARIERDLEKAERDRAILARDQVQAALTAAEAQLKAANDELKTAEVELKAANDELEAVEVELKAANDGLEAAKIKLGKAKQSKAQKSAQAEVERAKEVQKQAAEKLAAAKLQVTTANAKVTKFGEEITTAQSAVTPLKKKLKKKEKARREAQKTLDEAEAELAKAEAERCRDLRRGRWAANSLGLQLGVGLDLANFGDEFYSGLFFEPVVGLNFGVGMALIKGDQLNPGYAVGQVADPSQLGAYARESYMIRPYVGISVSFDIIRNIRAATKAPEVTQLGSGGAS
jgi:predicted  nucleic acid-binding Zn-ribbon protein